MLFRSGTVAPLISQLGQMSRRSVSSETHAQLADQYQWPLALAGLLFLVSPAAFGRREARS